MAETAAKHLSSRVFVAAARREASSAAAAHEDDGDAEAAAEQIADELQQGYTLLAENALVMIRAGDAEDGGKDSGKTEKAGRRVLAALDGLLAPGAYLTAIAPLLEHEDQRVRRKALRLVAHRLRAAAVASANRGALSKSKSRKARSRQRQQAHRQNSRQKRPTTTAMDDDDDDEQLEEELADEVAAASQMTPLLASLAGVSAGGATRAAASGALEAAAVRFSDASVSALDKKMATQIKRASIEFSKPLLATVPAMIESLSASEKSRAVVAAAANALAAVLTALGPRCVPVLPKAVPALFAATRKADSILNAVDTNNKNLDDEGHVLVACLRAVSALMEKMGGFLSPHLGDVLGLLLSPSLVPAVGSITATEAYDEATKTSATTAAEHAAALREALPRATPPRLLLAPLSDALHLALGDTSDDTKTQTRVSAAAAAAALHMAAASASSTPLPPAHRNQLIAMILRALDVRRDHPLQFDGRAVDAVEAAATAAFVTVASTLTESSFAPTLQRATEWAKARASDPHAARARLSALFRVASALADSLRGVFAPLATPILDLAAAALDPTSDPTSAEPVSAKKKRKKDKESGGKETVDETTAIAECDAWRTRARALGALRRICMHDSGDLLDASRFNQLHPLVTRCLTVKPPVVSPENSPFDLADLTEGDEILEGGVGREASLCVAQLIAAAPDDTLWKPAHRGVLQATRDSAPRARRVALAALTETCAKLQEEYLVLLPEAIPFLSELFEDPDEGVEGAARALTATLAELSGENLKSLMATGGE